MQRLISAVTALSVAVYVVPPFQVTPAMAEGSSDAATAAAAAAALVLPEGAFALDLDGQQVICLPNKKLECPEGAFCVVAKIEANCLKNAKKKMAAMGDAASADAAVTATDEAPATDQPAVEPAAEPAAEPQPAEQAVQEPAVEPQPAEQSVEEPAVELVPEDTATSEAVAAEASAAESGTTDAAPSEAAAPDAVTDTAPVEAPAASWAPRELTIGDQVVWCLPKDKTVACPDGATCVRPKSEDKCQAAAEKKLKQLAKAAAEDQAALEAAKKAQDEAARAAEAAGQPLIDAPTPTEAAVESLDSALAAPEATTGEAPAASAEPAAAAATAADAPAEAAPAPDATVSEQKVTEADVRASSQEFAKAPATTADRKKKTGLSDLEKVGLVALGALVVGSMLSNKNEVVSNTGDRVVVKDQQGNFQVYKDDDVLLRQPGANVRTETFADGSTRTTVQRKDGTSVVTIRDASGRVIRRTAYDANGLPTVLIDDTIPEDRVDVTRLPPPAQSVGTGEDAELAARMAELEAQKVGRKFSLRQIRTIPAVKALAAPIPVANVTFESGSAAIRPDQAEELAALGKAIKRMIRKNPNKIFLIEGHTDAVGGAAMNLTLSDRRAESVAKALGEYFDVPPENLVVQGYGESELLIDTADSERANRRVVVRDITALLRQGR